MQQAIEPTEISLDAYTLCSFLPTIDSARAVPLVLIGYRQSDDPYYAKVLHDPQTYFKKKLAKYVEETGSVKRGIEILIDCHQNHLAFTPLTELREQPFRHPLQVELVEAF